MTFPDFSHYRVLIVPGLNNSGAGHWQTRWQERYPAFERVEQDDWTHPDLPAWSRRLQQSLRSSAQPALLVAHSFGCLTTLHALQHMRHHAAAVLLVAPADPEKFNVVSLVSDIRLRCPSIVVGSENDPWMAGERAAYWAKRWRCGFVNAGARGHINADSGLGDWPEGLRHLALLADLALATRDHVA
jgi:predicted alpha/beta hydrolase family esterase